VEDRTDPVGVAADDAAHRVGVPSEKLGRAVDDEVGAEIERTLIDRGGERVVHYDRRPGGAGAVCQSGDVEHLQRRIRRALQVEQAAPPVDLDLDGLVVRGLAQSDVDPEPWQELDEKFVGGRRRCP